MSGHPPLAEPKAGHVVGCDHGLKLVSKLLLHKAPAASKEWWRDVRGGGRGGAGQLGAGHDAKVVSRAPPRILPGSSDIDIGSDKREDARPRKEAQKHMPQA